MKPTSSRSFAVRFVLVALLGASTVLFTPACSGGGGGNNMGNAGGSSMTNVAAGFTPDTPTPGAKTVSMSAGPGTGDTITVRVDVTDTADVGEIGFDVLFDPSAVDFVTDEPGGLFETAGMNPLYVVGEPTAGEVTVGVTVPVGGEVDVTGTRTIVELVFRVTRVGQFPLAFRAAGLRDGQQTPLAGIVWKEGSLTGS